MYVLLEGLEQFQTLYASLVIQCGLAPTGATRLLVDLAPGSEVQILANLPIQDVFMNHCSSTSKGGSSTDFPYCYTRHPSLKKLYH